MQLINAKKNYSFFFIVMVWAIYCAVFLDINQFDQFKIYTGWVLLSVSAALTFVSVCYAFWIWCNSVGRAKRIFAFITLACALDFVSNGIYQFLYNLSHFSHDSVSSLLISSYNLPYIGFLLFQVVVWLALLSKAKFYRGRIKGALFYLPFVLIVFVLSTVFFFPFAWNLKSITVYGAYNLLELFLQIAVFFAALFCLTVTKNRGIFYLAVSSIIIVTSDLIMNFGLFSQRYGVMSFVENGWVLGELLRIYSFSTIIKTRSYDVLPEDWVQEVKA